MRYKLPTDRLVNQLVPHYLSGRKYILFIQSLAHPLCTLNERFRELAREKHIEARMTSQVMYLEWYLNYKFCKYFRNASDKIYIADSTPLGVDIYHEGVRDTRPFTIWYEGEQIIVGKEDERPRQFYHSTEEKAVNKVSFMVCVPELAGWIEQYEFVYMLSFIVNTYKVAGKTYLIKIDGSEIEPNNNKRK